MTLSVDSSELRLKAPELRAGDCVRLYGTVYTARDAAHKRIFEMIKNGEPLPFPIKDSVIYYAGPTPTMPGKIIGSCGPTTSSRMNVYSPALYDMGLAATIGKGPRSAAVIDAIKRCGALYLAALGGIGALAAESISSLEVIAFPELGCESVKKLTFDGFPLYVGVDAHGNSIF